MQLWGRTTNPHNAAYSPGGSTGGEAALLALGGSRVGIGSDVAGSVRVPAHYSGCYALRCSVGRWPGSGVDSSTRGQEGVKSVFSPMAGSLDDLAYFAESVTGMSPWLYDHTVIPLRWRQDTALAYSQKETLRFGILRHDGKHTGGQNGPPGRPVGLARVSSELTRSVQAWCRRRRRARGHWTSSSRR